MCFQDFFDSTKQVIEVVFKANPFALVPIMTAGQLISESLLKKGAKKKLLLGLPGVKKFKFADIRLNALIADIFTKLTQAGLKSIQGLLVMTMRI